MKKVMIEGAIEIMHYYGVEPQADILLEEMGELIQAICKFKRKGCNLEAIPYNLIEEMADVSFMIEQFIVKFDCREEVKSIMKGKMERTLGKIEEDKRKRGL